MITISFGHRAKAAVLTCLTTLSGFSTYQLLTTGGEGAAGLDLASSLALPSEALDEPASYSVLGSVGRDMSADSRAQVIGTASVNGIPAAALAAYQRAETVINAADEGCRLPWELIAAVGRVESDHGRYGGNVLDDEGVSRPGIYGIALDGTRGTAEITDTDAGQFDNDKVYDRAVGPMQFIPSTWSVVGVDADGDAKRNPQDIDDAALATAVHLCSGNDDLSKDTGQRAAVHRYNHSQEYVGLVLSVMAAYTEGDYYSAPNVATSAVTFTRDQDYVRPVRTEAGRGHAKGDTALPAATNATTAPGPATSTVPTAEPAGPPPGDPVQAITRTVGQLQAAVQQVLSLPQAILRCMALGMNALTTPTRWNACISDLTTS